MNDHEQRLSRLEQAIQQRGDIVNTLWTAEPKGKVNE